MRRCPGPQLSDAFVTHPTRKGVSQNTAHQSHGAKRARLADRCGSGVAATFQFQPFVGTVNVTLNDNEGHFFETAPGRTRFSLVRGHGDRPGDRAAYHLQGRCRSSFYRMARSSSFRCLSFG